MPLSHVDLVGLILINMLIMLTLEACSRIFREPEAGEETLLCKAADKED